MTIQDMTYRLGQNWKTVKAIDQKFLEHDYRETDYQKVPILAIEQISFRRGHRYLIVGLDYESGGVVWVGNDRKEQILLRFFL